MTEWWWVIAGYGITVTSVSGYILLLSRRAGGLHDDADGSRR